MDETQISGDAHSQGMLVNFEIVCKQKWIRVFNGAVCNDIPLYNIQNTIWFIDLLTPKSQRINVYTCLCPLLCCVMWDSHRYW